MYEPFCYLYPYVYEAWKRKILALVCDEVELEFFFLPLFWSGACLVFIRWD